MKTYLYRASNLKSTITFLAIDFKTLNWPINALGLTVMIITVLRQCSCMH